MSDLFYKIGEGRMPQVSTLTHGCGFKIVGLKALNSPKLVFFGINLPQRGISL